jgi:hypothetical protein
VGLPWRVSHSFWQFTCDAVGCGNFECHVILIWMCSLEGRKDSEIKSGHFKSSTLDACRLRSLICAPFHHISEPSSRPDEESVSWCVMCSTGVKTWPKYTPPSQDCGYFLLIEQMEMVANIRGHQEQRGCLTLFQKQRDVKNRYS